MKKTLLKIKRLKINKISGNYLQIEDNAPHKVALLPYKLEDHKKKILCRMEPIAARKFRKEICSFTGTGEIGETPQETAVRELFEESGFQVDTSLLEDLGIIYTSKITNSFYNCFAIDLTGIPGETPPGDGSVIEKYSRNFWAPLKNIKKHSISIKDSIFLGLLHRYICTR